MKKLFSPVLILLMHFIIVDNVCAQTEPHDLDTLHGIKWMYQTHGAIHGSALKMDETIYIGSGDQFLYALDKISGKLKWKFKTRGAIHSTPAASGQQLFFTSSDGNLYALNKDGGSLCWKFETQGEKKQDIWDYFLSSPVVAGNHIYFGSGDGRFYALNKENGQIIWSYATGGINHSTPVVDEQKVYFGSFDGWFYSLNRKNGTPAWRFNTIGQRWFPEGAVQRGATLKDNQIFFGSRDFNLYALNAQTGKGLWNRYEQGSWVVAPPALKDTLLLFGTSDSHYFYALDTRSGREVWKRKLNLNVFGQAETGEHLVYFGCLNGKLYALDLNTGDIRWEFQTHESRQNWNVIFDETHRLRKDLAKRYNGDFNKIYQAIHSLGSIVSKPLLDDGKLYFGSMNGRIYCIH